MVGFTGKALSRDIHVDGAEIAEARWFTREEFRRAMESGEVQVPRGISISSSLIQNWYGDELVAGW